MTIALTVQWSFADNVSDSTSFSPYFRLPTTTCTIGFLPILSLYEDRIKTLGENYDNWSPD